MSTQTVERSILQVPHRAALAVAGEKKAVTVGTRDVGGTRDAGLLVDRLQRLLDESGLSARALSKQARLGDTYVNDVLTRKNSNPSIPAIQAIAKVLDTSIGYLVGETEHHTSTLTPRSVMPMPIIGIAETGAFRKLSDSSVFVMLQRPLSQSYPTAKHFALSVGDDYMNAAGKEGAILPGTEVLCVDMYSAGLQVESGKIYAIRRTMDGGHTYETIVRRAMVFRDRVELIAESAKPGNIEKIVIPGGLGVDPQQVIFALGLVYGVFRGFE